MSLSNEFKPSLAQVFRWAANLEIPTREERIWLNDSSNASWKQYIEVLRDSISESRAPRDVGGRTLFQRTFRLTVRDAALVGKAKGRSPGQVEARLVDNHDRELLVFRGTDPAVLNLRIVERLPLGRPKLRIGGLPVELLSDFGNYGYATINASAMEPVLSGREALEVAILPDPE
jgi:hypothetical protein